MRSTIQRLISLFMIALFGIGAIVLCGNDLKVASADSAQATPTPVPQTAFDQPAAIARLKEQIKGKEKEPSGTVFKNIQSPTLKERPAAQLLAVMEFGYARSLGVNCTHCHVPDKWESDEKAQKQIARDMSAMVARLNGEMLKGIKGLAGKSPTVNCTTCHRGEIKPALNLPVAN